MPLDATGILTKTEAINGAFHAIGFAGDTTIPRVRTPAKGKAKAPAAKKRGADAASGKTLAAWEYHVASQLLRIAETRRERAHEAAVKAGVLFDHKAKPEPVGTLRVVYAGAVIEIRLQVVAPIEQLDPVGFIADLGKAGVSLAVLKRLSAKHTKIMRAAHKFTSSLVSA